MSRITFETLRERLRERPPRRIADPAAAEAAVALILTPRAEDLQALFIRRAEMPGDPWSGQMALPGGRRDPADPDLRATALRETQEETGITLTGGTELGVLDDFAPRAQALPRIVVRPYVFGLTEQPPVTLSAEAAYHVWIPMSELRRGYSSAEVDARGTRMVMPAFVVGPHVIWGLTERILAPFIELYFQVSTHGSNQPNG